MADGTGSRASSPAQVIEDFARHLGEGDVDNALRLYEPDAAFVVEAGVTVHGLGAVREALERFAALRPTLTGEIQKVVEAGGTALVINKWELAGTGPDGSAIAMAGVSADVVRASRTAVGAC